MVIRETVYGIVKRLDFFIQHIEAYRKEIGLKPGEVGILDVGCGTGVNVAVPLANAGYSVLGLDRDPASIDLARRLAPGLKNIEFCRSSLEDQNFNQCFRVVICSEVLEHLQRPEVMLQRMTSALNEEGLLLVTVPNGFGYFELDSFFWRVFSRHPYLVSELYKWEDRFWKVFGSSKTLQRRREEYRPERLESILSTLAPDTAHYQSFTHSKITRLLKSQGFRLLELRNNTFLAGNFLGLFARELDGFLSWNSRVADRFPSFLVSGWLIAAQRPHELKESLI